MYFLLRNLIKLEEQMWIEDGVMTLGYRMDPRVR